MAALSRIVVADDDPLILKLFGELLRKDRSEAVLCPGGRKALEAALREEPDLLILDLDLPGLSGLEVIRDLRAKRILAPALVMADPAHPALPAALSLSGVSFLSKPFTLAECRQAIARALVGARR